MIKPNIIKGLYKKHQQTNYTKKEPNFKNLISVITKLHSIEISETNLIIQSIQKNSPFHEIPLKNILGIENIESHIAIILGNSIIFLKTDSPEIHVHINIEPPSFWQKIKYMIQKEY